MSIIQDISSEYIHWVLLKKPGETNRGIADTFGFAAQDDSYDREYIKLYRRAMGIIAQSKIHSTVQVPEKDRVDWIQLYSKLANGKRLKQCTVSPDKDKQSLSISLKLDMTKKLSDIFQNLMEYHIKLDDGQIKFEMDKTALPFGCVFRKDSLWNNPSWDHDRWLSGMGSTEDLAPNVKIYKSNTKGSSTKFACFMVRCMGLRL